VALRLLENLGRILTRFTNLILYIHSSRALWMGDQPIARPVPTQESTTLKDEKKHEWLEQDSNPQFQYPSGQGLCLRPQGQCVRRPFSISNVKQVSRVSSVSIVSGYGLDDRAIEVRSPAEAKTFSSSLHVQTSSGAHPASCTMGTGGPFPGAKARPWRDADHSPPSSAEVDNK
jgi:hypothetical protein